MEDEHDYDRVSFNGASDDDDEVYQIPRNVVSGHTVLKSFTIPGKSLKSGRVAWHCS